MHVPVHRGQLGEPQTTAVLLQHLRDPTLHHLGVVASRLKGFGRRRRRDVTDGNGESWETGESRSFLGGIRNVMVDFFHQSLSDGLPVLTLRWRSRGVGPVVMLAVHLPDVSPSTEASTVVAPRPWGPHGGVRLAPAGVHWSTVGLTQGRPRLLVEHKI